MRIIDYFENRIKDIDPADVMKQNLSQNRGFNGRIVLKLN